LAIAHGDRDTRHLSYDYFRYAGRDWRFFEPVYARLNPSPPVLDVGSGLGLFVECCQHHGTPVVGLEISREGVEASAKRHLSVVRADLTLPFPFRDGKFGSALVHHVLEHVRPEEERRILRETWRVLRPEGTLFVVSPNVYHPGAREDPDHINLFSPHQLRTELRTAGFRNVSLGPNFWRPFWDPEERFGRLSGLIEGALWKVLPVDRFAASSAALARK